MLPNNSKPMLMVALETAASGFRVLPVSPESKRPLIKDWPNKATSDSTQITAWWKQYPNAMVGVATGGINA
jgi:hypothetical protein